MDIWKKLKGELIDIVEAPEHARDQLVYRFERLNNEIKNGAKLIVREGQAAVFVNMGQVADAFQPGMYNLDTKNLPILSTLLGWKYGFESPFKAECYFVATRQFTGLKWGTQNPVMLRDPEFGPVRLRAFGSYSIKVVDPAALIREVAGPTASFTVEGITDQLRNMIVARFSEAVAESRVPVLDLAANATELGGFVTAQISDGLKKFGFELTTLQVENMSLPPEVEQALDKRTSMGVIGNLNAYAQFQAAEALRDAAKNPGAAGQMMGVMMGGMLGGQVAGTMAGAQQAGAMPPPLPAAAMFFIAINGQQQGPFDLAALAQRAREGALNAQSLVWKQGMPSWAPASTVPDLAAILPPPAPPPIPGSPPPVPPAG